MTETNADQPHHPGQRIAKAMARAGLCSRREAEAWILAGRVSVNGEKLASPAINVVEGDDIRVDGEPLKAHERTRLFLFHKPRGLVTTARDPEGRPTIFSALPKDLPRVVAVGRLDINTEGLLLLTNDGGLARVLELPATGWLRRYRVRAHGAVDQAALDGLREGVSIEGVHYAGIEARLERTQGSNVWLTMGLREGKNREIKRVLEQLGLSVNRLIRISFGPFELADLAEGEVVEARTRVLRDQLGPRLAREAGVDFDAPLVERAEPEPEPAPAAETRRAPRCRASSPAALDAAPAGARRTATARRAAPRTAALGRPGAQAQAHRRAARRERRRRGGDAQADRAFGDQRPQGPRRRGRARAADPRGGAPPRSWRAARPKRAARAAPRAPASHTTPRDRAEGGERPPRRPERRFGEARSAEHRGGEAAPREDRAPRPPRAGKPYAPRDRAEGGARRQQAVSSLAIAATPSPRPPREDRPPPPRAGKPFAPRDRAEGGARRQQADSDLAIAATPVRARRATIVPPRAGKPFAPRDRAEGGPRAGKSFSSRDRSEAPPPRGSARRASRD